MQKFFEAVGAMIVMLVFISIVSLMPTGLWFCFDDALAEVAGVPGLGKLHWYNVWPATIFIGSVFRNLTYKDSSI